MSGDQPFSANPLEYMAARIIVADAAFIYPSRASPVAQAATVVSLTMGLPLARMIGASFRYLVVDGTLGQDWGAEACDGFPIAEGPPAVAFAEARPPGFNFDCRDTGDSHKRAGVLSRDPGPLPPSEPDDPVLTGYVTNSVTPVRERGSDKQVNDRQRRPFDSASWWRDRARWRATLEPAVSVGYRCGG